MGVPCTAGCYEEVLGAEGLLAFSVPDVLSTPKPQQLGPFNNDMAAGAENKTSQQLGAGFVTTHASKDHSRKKSILQGQGSCWSSTNVHSQERLVSIYGEQLVCSSQAPKHSPSTSGQGMKCTNTQYSAFRR